MPQSLQIKVKSEFCAAIVKCVKKRGICVIPTFFGKIFFQLSTYFRFIFPKNNLSLFVLYRCNGLFFSLTYGGAGCRIYVMVIMIRK